MSDTAHDTTDISRTIRWIAAHGVAVEHWPSQDSHVLAPPPALRQPLLYLLEPGTDPPVTAGLQDWVRLPAPEHELLARAEALLAQARLRGAVLTSLDVDGVLQVGDKLVVLSPLDTRLMQLLLDDVGRVVGRHEIERSLWPDKRPDDSCGLNNRLKLLRRQLAPLPLKIHTVRGRGLLLEIAPLSKRSAPDVYAPAGSPT